MPNKQLQQGLQQGVKSRVVKVAFIIPPSNDKQMMITTVIMTMILASITVSTAFNTLPAFNPQIAVTPLATPLANKPTNRAKSSLSVLISTGSTPTYTWSETSTTLTITSTVKSDFGTVVLTHCRPGNVEFKGEKMDQVYVKGVPLSHDNSTTSEPFTFHNLSSSHSSSYVRNCMLLLNKNGGLYLSVSGVMVFSGILRGEVLWDTVFWTREDGVVKVEMEKVDLVERWEMLNEGGKEGVGFNERMEAGLSGRVGDTVGSVEDLLKRGGETTLETDFN